jgi:hypothetical protein
MKRAELAAAIRSLLALGLTTRDLAVMLRAHERAIEALIG